MTLAESVREYLLDDAVRAGKFPSDRKHVYRDMFDRDPQGTLTLINSLAPGIEPGVAAALDRLGERSPYPRELFPELRRRPRAVLAAAITHAAEEPPSLPSPVAEAPLPVKSAPVAGWSEQLFPEVRRRKAKPPSRVTRADE
jgi:hypothetical protein